MYHLARRIVAADAESLVVRAFSENVCARVRFVAERALVRRDVARFIGYFAIVYLAICEFEEGGAICRV